MPWSDVVPAAAISNIDIGSLYVERPVNRAAPDLYKRARNARFAATHLSEVWDDLGEDSQQQQAIDLAYRVVEPRIGPKRLLNQLILRLGLAFIALVDPDGARPFYAYIEAMEEFADAVLNEIEKSDDGYQAQLSQAVSEVVEDGDSLEAIDLNDVDGWLDALSSEAHSEV